MPGAPRLAAAPAATPMPRCMPGLLCEGPMLLVPAAIGSCVARLAKRPMKKAKPLVSAISNCLARPDDAHLKLCKSCARNRASLLWHQVASLPRVASYAIRQELQNKHQVKGHCNILII